MSRIIKIEHEYEIRRVKLEKSCITFTELNSIIHKIFANKIGPEDDFFLKYIDSGESVLKFFTLIADGDLVTISSEDEWKCAFESTNRVKCPAQSNKLLGHDNFSLTQFEAMEIAQQLVLIRSLLLRLIEHITADRGIINSYNPTKDIDGHVHSFQKKSSKNLNMIATRNSNAPILAAHDLSNTIKYVSTEDYNHTSNDGETVRKKVENMEKRFNMTKKRLSSGCEEESDLEKYMTTNFHLPRRSGNLSFYTSSENFDLPSLLRKRSLRLSNFSSSLSQLMIDTQSTAVTSEPPTGISGISFKSTTSYPFKSFEFPVETSFMKNKPFTLDLGYSPSMHPPKLQDFETAAHFNYPCTGSHVSSLQSDYSINHISTSGMQSHAFSSAKLHSSTDSMHVGVVHDFPSQYDNEPRIVPGSLWISSRLNTENDLTNSLNREFQSFKSLEKSTVNEPDKLNISPPSKRSSMDYCTPPLQSHQSYINASRAMECRVGEHNNLVILSEPPKGNSLCQLDAPLTNQALHCGANLFTGSVSQISSDVTSGYLSDHFVDLNSAPPIDITFPEFSIPLEHLLEVPNCSRYSTERIISKPVVSSCSDEKVHITVITSRKADHLAIIPLDEMKRPGTQTPEYLLMSPSSLNLESYSSTFHSVIRSKQSKNETNYFSQRENKSQKARHNFRSLCANYVCDQVLTRAISSTSQTIMDAPISNRIVEENKRMIPSSCRKPKAKLGFQVLDAKLSEESLDKLTNKCTEIVEPTVGLLPQFTIRTGELITSHADQTIHSPLGFQELVPEIHFLSTTISVVEQQSAKNNLMI